MSRTPDSTHHDEHDDADARGEHLYRGTRAGRPTAPQPGSIERRGGQYAAGADGTQQVNAAAEPIDTARDPLPPSPLSKERAQPPIEPQK